MSEKPEPTEEQIENYLQNLLNKFKQDPQYELKQELGRFCMRHIDDLTPIERQRYDYLIKTITT